MRTALIALMLTFASQAGAECGKFCDFNWWKTATSADVKVELDGSADIMGRVVYGGYSPLHLATTYGTLASMQVLLDAGADVTARNEFGYTPLHEASLSINPAKIQVLLDAGADVTARTVHGVTPLHNAARYGTLASIQVLLDAGADVMAKYNGGYTPLHDAARCDRCVEKPVNSNSR